MVCRLCLRGSNWLWWKRESVLAKPSGQYVSVTVAHAGGGGALTTQSGDIPPVQADPGLCTFSSVRLQAGALHRWVGHMAAIEDATLVEFVR